MYFVGCHHVWLCFQGGVAGVALSFVLGHVAAYHHSNTNDTPIHLQYEHAQLDLT